MKNLLSVIFAGAALAASCAWAGNLASPVGLWTSVDDDTGKPNAMIRLTESAGYFQGKIEKVIAGPGQDPNPKCTKCQDGGKGKPINDMIILAGLHKDADEYNGGHLLDPFTGKVYKCKMELIEGGKKLKVRRYIGVSILGSTQIWTRAD